MTEKQIARMVNDRAEEILAIVGEYLPELEEVETECLEEVAVFIRECYQADIESDKKQAHKTRTAQRTMA